MEIIPSLTTKYKKKIACINCKGNGIVSYRKFMGHSEGNTNITEECQACNGKGLLHRIATIEYYRIDETT